MNFASISAPQVQLLNDAYAALRDSVYGAPVLQTRLPTYLDRAELIIDASGVSVSFASLETWIAQGITTDAVDIANDLLDFHRYGGEDLANLGWRPVNSLAALHAVAMTPELANVLAENRVQLVSGTAVATYSAGSILLGRQGVDSFTGGAGADVLVGAGGNDTLTAAGDGDTLDGGAGDDTLAGPSGSSPQHTTYIGGTGNDAITGNYYGSNTYVFNRGDGQDTVVENGYDYYGEDTLRFGAGVSADQLWFVQNGNDLEISVIGTADRVLMRNWYSSTNHHVETLELSGGQRLLDDNVQALVQAMASFAPPSAGQTSLPPNYASTLQPTIAANWQ